MGPPFGGPLSDPIIQNTGTPVLSMIQRMGATGCYLLITKVEGFRGLGYVQA